MTRTFPTMPRQIHLEGLTGIGQIRFLAVIPHGKGTREVAVDVPANLIVRIADALRATQGTACDSKHRKLVDGTDEGYHCGHAIWHVERPELAMPCIDHSSVIDMSSLPDSSDE